MNYRSYGEVAQDIHRAAHKLWGVTRSRRHCLTHPHEAQRVLLVDDSILSGRSLRRRPASS